MDFLGLRNLTVLDDAARLVRRSHPDFHTSQIPEDDPATFQMLSEGRTSGVFQMESAGMTGVCIGLKPQSIEDITAIIALYRPGPMESIDVYKRQGPGGWGSPRSVPLKKSRTAASPMWHCSRSGPPPSRPPSRPFGRRT